MEHARLLGREVGDSFDQIEGGEESVSIVPSAGHTGLFRTEPTAYIQRLVKFFGAHLSAPQSSNQSSVLSDDDSTEA